jgi:hypothetical protein
VELTFCSTSLPLKAVPIGVVLWTGVPLLPFLVVGEILLQAGIVEEGLRARRAIERGRGRAG